MRARRSAGDRRDVGGRRRPHHALVANVPAERPKAAVGGGDVRQGGRVRLPTARRRTERCRVRVPRGRAIAHRLSRPDRSGSTRPTCAMRQVGRSRSSIGGAKCRSLDCARDDGESSSRASEVSRGIRARPQLSDNRWSGKKHAVPATRGAPSAGVAWCNGQRITRLPLSGTPAVTSRRRRTTHSHVSRPPPARARCRTHLAPEARQREARITRG